MSGTTILGFALGFIISLLALFFLGVGVAGLVMAGVILISTWIAVT